MLGFLVPMACEPMLMLFDVYVLAAAVSFYYNVIKVDGCGARITLERIVLLRGEGDTDNRYRCRCM